MRPLVGKERQNRPIAWYVISFSNRCGSSSWSCTFDRLVDRTFDSGRLNGVAIESREILGLGVYYPLEDIFHCG